MLFEGLILKYGKNNILIGLLVLVVFIIFGAAMSTKIDTKDERLFSEVFNDLHVTIREPYTTPDEDDGKIIINFPVTLTNRSDHAFRFNTSEIYYNGTTRAKMGFLFSNLNQDFLNGKIKKGEFKEGVISIKLGTRNSSEIKTVEPIFEIYDMKSEESKDIKPTMKLQ